MILQSMTSKVLELCKTTADDSLDDQNNWTLHCLGVLDKLENYAKFLMMPLELWMFVPVDKDGYLWKYPPTEEERIWAENDSTEAELSYNNKVEAYQQAKNNVIFEGFEVVEGKTGESIYPRTVKTKIGGVSIYAAHFDTITQSWKMSIGIKRIEQLTPYGLTITETAIKKYGL